MEKKELIVVIEDEPILQKLFQRALKPFGVEVLIQTSAPEAIIVMETDDKFWEYLLVISDIQMPDMTGYEFVRDVLKQHPQWEKLKVIMTSGNEPDEKEMESIKSYKIPFFQKPFDITLFQTKVSELIGKQMKQS